MSQPVATPAYQILDGEPAVPMLGLETVWFQIAGTLCNLTCQHCFVECSPTNHTHGLMSMEQLKSSMEEAIALGAKHFGFTGGEPFLHRDILPILGFALEQAPSLVLSNGTLFTPRMAASLKALVDRSRHPLDVRVSLDGVTAEQHDSVRGAGSFERALRGIRCLAEAGIRPSIATTATWGETCPDVITAQMQSLLAEHGIEGVAVRIFPDILLGQEERRLRPYRPQERVTARCVVSANPQELMCSGSRLVTERGVWVCTLLANVESARMGDTLADTLTPFKITHGACFTCFTQGVKCTNG